jgi:hypothetical protein
MLLSAAVFDARVDALPRPASRTRIRPVETPRRLEGVAGRCVIFAVTLPRLAGTQRTNTVLQ